MNKISKYFSIVIFFSIIAFFSFYILISKKPNFSHSENRSLLKFPKFSLSSVYLDNGNNIVKASSFMDNVDTYLCDHFPFRNTFLFAKTDLEVLTGKNEVNNVFIADNQLLKRFNKPDYKLITDNILYINQFAKNVDTPVYFMLVPTSTGIYRELLPRNSNSYEQRIFINNVYNKLDKDKIVTVDVFSALYSVRDEYIYYRTDNHLNTLGAYYAYADAIKAMGQIPLLTNQFDISHVSFNFNGSYYSQVLYNKIKPDNIDIYSCNNGTNISSINYFDGKVNKKVDNLYFMDYLNKKDKYSVFTGDEVPIISVNTDSKSNKKLLLIKDSYANSMLSFFTQHYSRIDMVDLSCLEKTMADYAVPSDYDQILFVYNTEDFSKSNSIYKLSEK